MKKISRLFAFFALLFLISSCAHKSVVEYVNPFIGTGGHGHTFPGATVPFGMVQLSPDTRLTGWDGCSGYHYTDSIVYGFSHTHLSGTGISDYADLLLQPITGAVKLQSGYISETEKTDNGYGSIFRKETESAEVGYYTVFLDKYKVKAELTATNRVGMHRYTFPESDDAHILIDLAHRDEVLESFVNVVSETEIEGYRVSKAWADKQYFYFVAQFSKPIENYQIAINDSIQKEISKAEGKNLKLIINFSTEDNEEVIVKVGISAVSMEGARKNLTQEVPNWNFDEIREATKKLWEKELSAFEITDDSEEEKTIFYTALYHNLIVPNTYFDVDGKFRGTDLEVHESENYDYYTVFSLWDTYRATHPLYTLVQQKRTNDFIKTFLTQYEQSGRLPMWEFAGNCTRCMIGYHSIPVIADAFMKGIADYDADIALKAMVEMAKMNELGKLEYVACGYIPGDMEHESVSKTLEYAYDDWCIALMAKKMGNEEIYKEFNVRAQSYKNIYDPQTSFIRAKIGGAWYYPYNPREVNFHYTEANSWQYTFYTPQDFTGLMNLMGGSDKFEQKLDELFTTNSQTTGREHADISGLVGQYAHGNEPSHHMAYLYSYVGKAWKTQEMTRRLMTEMYSTEPDGLIGNEDCGQMSAWYVMSALGFYPVTPASNIYVIGTPIFKETKINFENGKVFIIKANNVSDENFYIQSATLNGAPLTRSYLTHSEIIDGGEIVFEMGNTPNETWGSGEGNVPVSEITDNLICPVPFAKNESQVFYDSVNVELVSSVANGKIFYTLDGSEPTASSTMYEKPILLTETTTIKFFAQLDDGTKSKIVETVFTKVKSGMKLTLNTKYAALYASGGDIALIDGVKGKDDFRLGAWQGYAAVDVDAVIDFGSVQRINGVSVNFIQDINSWVFLPLYVEFLVSNDGVNFTSLAKITHNVATDNWDIINQKFAYEKAFSCKYLKVIGKNMGKCPENHKAAGYDAWIFADEISVF